MNPDDILSNLHSEPILYTSAAAHTHEPTTAEILAAFDRLMAFPNPWRRQQAWKELDQFVSDTLAELELRHGVQPPKLPVFG